MLRKRFTYFASSLSKRVILPSLILTSTLWNDLSKKRKGSVDLNQPSPFL